MNNETTFIVDAIDELTSAVEDLSQNIIRPPPAPPIMRVIDRISALLSQDNVPALTLAELADCRHAAHLLNRQFRRRFYGLFKSRTAIPDTGKRPTVSEALQSDKTADALGALLRITEYLAGIEAQYPTPGEPI